MSQSSLAIGSTSLPIHTSAAGTSGIQPSHTELAKYEPNKTFKKVLIVDEDRAVVDVHRRIIEGATLDKDGFCVEKFVFAYNGNQAYQLFLENPDIDLIITDGCMPGMYGPKFAKKVREHGEAKKSYVPILMVSANAKVPKMLEDALEKELADAIFVKGGRIDEFRDKLREIIELRSYFAYKVYSAQEEGIDDESIKYISFLLESLKGELPKTKDELLSCAIRIENAIEHVNRHYYKDLVEAYLLIKLSRKAVGWNCHPERFQDRPYLDDLASECCKKLFGLADSVKEKIIGTYKGYGRTEAELNRNAKERMRNVK